MIRIVKSPVAKIESSDKRDKLIDYNDLLMMGP
jgi:hypothetical protein